METSSTLPRSSSIIQGIEVNHSIACLEEVGMLFSALLPCIACVWSVLVLVFKVRTIYVAIYGTEERYMR